MKKIFLIPFLCVSSFLFSQGTTVNFIVQGDTAFASDMSALKNATLPLKLYFNSGFNGKTIEIKRKSDNQLLVTAKTFGATANGVPKAETQGSYKITVGTDKTTNTGDNVDTEFYLKIGNQRIQIQLKQESGGGNGDPTPTDPPTADNYLPGYIYYDALMLVKPTTKAQTKKNILKAYGITESNYKENKYIADLYKGTVFPNIQGAESVLAAVGGKDVTYMAAGLARFIAERAKEELNEAFFRKMKEQLIAYPELSTVFPKTTSMMKMIDSYAYTAVIQALRDAFETDVRNLPENLYEIKNLNTYNCFGIKDTDQKKECEARMDTIRAFFQKPAGKWTALALYTAKTAPVASNPAELLKSVTGSTELGEVKQTMESKNKATYNVISSIELSNLLSQSLLSKDAEEVWISYKKLDSLFLVKNAFEAYLGLLYATEKQKKEDKKIRFYDKTNVSWTFQRILDSNFTKYKNLDDLVKNTHTAFNTANSAIKKIEAATKNSTEADPQALYNYYKTFMASVKPIVQNPLLKTYAGDSIEAKYYVVESYLTPSADLAYHLSVKQYSSAVYDASILIGKLAESNKKLEPVAKSFIKYGTLISTVATAESSDEVKKALEASVLPMGSSAIKRNSRSSVTINSYCGVFYGNVKAQVKDTIRDKVTGKLDTVSKSVTYRSYGLYAPVGIALSKGSKSGWGASVILQAVDLGALVNFYLAEGDKTALPTDFKVSLANIFAPGAQLGINIPRTPFTITGGAQWVPALNRIDQITSGSTISASNAWRWQASLVMDIPLFNIKVKDFEK